ncbi:MAG TPA: hypothetical protein VM492_16275, partial [Sumerlaeia bacterium]|nr:hypothetical protein [Sumerlaeia bacterium]
MKRKQSVQSPLALRLFIWFASALFAVLLIWLLGFVLDDVGKFKTIDSRAIEVEIIGEENLDRQETLRARVAEVQRETQAVEERRAFRKDNVNTSRETLNQMLELERMNLEKNVPVSPDQQKVVAEAERTFLENQQAYQEAGQDLLARQKEKREIEASLAALDKEINDKRQEAGKEIRRLSERRDLIGAGLKFLVLLPALVAAGWLFLKKRSGPFAPLVYATGFAVLWRLVWIIHEHFPTRYYKYIFLVAALAAVLQILLVLIRAAVRPAQSVLLKRYREGYRKGQCPICAYPILRGTARLAHLARQGAGGGKIALSVAPGSEE